MDTAHLIAINLRKAMDARGMNALALSMDTRVPASRISNLLNAKTANPGIVTLRRVVDGLGITVNDLLVKESA